MSAACAVPPTATVEQLHQAHRHNRNVGHQHRQRKLRERGNIRGSAFRILALGRGGRVAPPSRSFLGDCRPVPVGDRRSLQGGRRRRFVHRSPALRRRALRQGERPSSLPDQAGRSRHGRHHRRSVVRGSGRASQFTTVPESTIRTETHSGSRRRPPTPVGMPSTVPASHRTGNRSSASSRTPGISMSVRGAFPLCSMTVPLAPCRFRC